MSLSVNKKYDWLLMSLLAAVVIFLLMVGKQYQTSSPLKNSYYYSGTTHNTADFPNYEHHQLKRAPLTDPEGLEDHFGGSNKQDHCQHILLKKSRKGLPFQLAAYSFIAAIATRLLSNTPVNQAIHQRFLISAWYSYLFRFTPF